MVLVCRLHILVDSGRLPNRYQTAPLTRFYELRRYISFYLYLYCTVRRPCTSYLLITNNRINVHITLSSEQDVCLNTKYTDNAHRCIKPAAKILKVHGCTPLARQLQWQCQHAHVWSCNHWQYVHVCWQNLQQFTIVPWIICISYFK